MRHCKTCNSGGGINLKRKPSTLRYYTIGGGIGHIVWSSYYQNRGAPETYLLGFAVALANM